MGRCSEQAYGEAGMNKIICWFRGHDYKVAQVFTPESRKLCCQRCNEKFAMNDRVRVLVRWSAEFERLYKDFGYTMKD